MDIAPYTIALPHRVVVQDVSVVRNVLMTPTVGAPVERVPKLEILIW